MSFEEEFDKIIRRKAEEEKYPFEESNWERTSMLLDAERKAERMLNLKKFYLPALMVLGIGISGILTYSYFNAKTESGSTLVSKNENLRTDKSTEKINENTAIAEKGNNPSIPQLTSENNTKQTEISEKSTNQAHTSPEGQTVLSSPASEVRMTRSKNTMHTAGNVRAQQVGSVANSIEPSDPANEGPGNSGGQTSSLPVVKQNSQGHSSDQNNINQTPVGTVDTEPMNENVLARENITSEQLSGVNSSLPYVSLNPEIRSTPFSVLNRYDEDYFKNRPKKTHYLNVEAGANYLSGWDSKGGTDAKGVNWFGGLNYGFYLSKKISVGLGVQAYNIGKITQPFYVNSKKDYGFGSTTHYTVITCNELYYVSLPLKLNYVINSSNSLGLGINAGYLVGAKNTLETYSVQDENGKSPVTREHASGVYKGISSTNLMFSMHYTAKLAKRVGVNVEFNYGLTDIFENKGTTNTLEKPMGLKLSLQYTLFDK